MKTVTRSSETAVPAGPLGRAFRRFHLRRALALACVLGAFTALPLLAASTDGDDAAVTAAGGPNTRALRLSSVEGQARVVQDGEVVADPALANMPLFSGSQITTGDDGRVEIQLEDGGIVRLSPNSTLTFPAIAKQGSNAHTEVVLNNGLAYFDLQPSTSENSLRVSYGAATFAATSYSVVRVTMDAPPGNLAVFSGNVHLDRGDALQLDIHGGETLNLETADASHYNLLETIQPDSWDTWNADRDQLLNAESTQQTDATSAYGTSVAGMSDLDANGSWYNVPGQGYLWSPYDAQAQGASWDPYGYGHWVFYPGRGWVWVSGYGWGYAAFGCGTWNYFDSFGWGWNPGGGCSPWWGGYGGWGYNIGTYPRGYQPPRRPILPPRHPRPVGTGVLLASRVVPVDRRVPVSGAAGIYGRPSQPVTIAGHVLEPLKPIATRPSYGHTSERAFGTPTVGRPANGYFPAPSRPGTVVAGARPGMPGSLSGSRPASPAPSHGSSSGGSSHTVSSGGGGGGHVSSGGGGGVGGGGHASGGGGGGGSHH